MSNNEETDFTINNQNYNDKIQFDNLNNSYLNTPKYDFMNSNQSCYETNLNSEYSSIFNTDINIFNEESPYHGVGVSINKNSNNTFINMDKDKYNNNENNELSSLKNDLNLMNYSNAVYNHEELKNNINAKKYGYNKLNQNFNQFNKLENEEKNLDIKSINSYHSKENSVLSLKNNYEIDNNVNLKDISVNTSCFNTYNSEGDGNSTTATKMSNLNSNNNLLSRKKGRPLNDTKIIIDNGVALDPNENLEEYMKARKKIQNRESQQKSRMMKKDISKNHEKEFEEIIYENGILKQENQTLKLENGMLKDQIAFLKSLISQNFKDKNENTDYNCELKNSLQINNSNNNQYCDIISCKSSNHSTTGTNNNSNSSTNSNTFSNNSNQNISLPRFLVKNSKSNKIFSIMIVCLLGIICIMTNNSGLYNNNLNSFQNSGFSLKSEEVVSNENDNFSYSYSIYTRVLSFFVFFLSIIYLFTMFLKEYLNKKKFQ